MDKRNHLRKVFGTYECVLMLPSVTNENAASAANIRLVERLKANGSAYAKGTM